MKKAAAKIHKMGSKKCTGKGGHLEKEALDILYDGKDYYYFNSERINTKIHGTGCTYSSAIASNLALGMGLENAVRKQKFM